jgi:hypothetical protein
MSDQGPTSARNGSSIQVKSAVDLAQGSASTSEQGLGGFFLAQQDASMATARRIGPFTGRPQKRGKAAKRAGTSLSDSSTYQARYAIGRYLEQAEREAKRLVELAEASDSPGLALGVEQLTETLRHLWKLRKAREDEWAEVVNVLQGVLNQVVAEQTTAAQATALFSVIRNHLAMGTVADHQPKQVRAILREAGLDPWAPLQLQESEETADSRE